MRVVATRDSSRGAGFTRYAGWHEGVVVEHDGVLYERETGEGIFGGDSVRRVAAIPSGYVQARAGAVPSASTIEMVERAHVAE